VNVGEKVGNIIELAQMRIIHTKKLLRVIFLKSFFISDYSHYGN